MGFDMEPVQVTRILFQDFSSVAVVAFYLAGIAALTVFAYGTYAQIRKYRYGRATDEAVGIWGRAIAMVKSVLTHRTLSRRDRLAGRAHGLIFFGFVALFIATATITLEYDVTARLFGWHFWHGAFYLWFSLIVDIAGIGFVAGLLVMMIRRGWIKPPKLDYARPDRTPADSDYDRSSYRREDWAFLWATVIIGVTGYVLEASRLVWLGNDPAVWNLRWWSPVGAILAELFKAVGLGPDGAGVLRLATWWFHGLLALTFIALIPFTKVKHILTAPASLMFRNPLAAQRLPKVDPELERPGYGFITDLTWKHLLNLDACTKCGRCHEVCPARTVGAPLSPRDVILSLREFANETLTQRTLPDEAKLSIHGKDAGQVFMETLWSCRTCMACVEICPVAVEHVPIIVQMRRKLVEEGNMDPTLQKTLQTIHKTGNSFGETKRKRPAWTKALPFAIKDARKEPVDVLWFVGDYASFDPRNQKVTQTFARLLKGTDIDFGILFEGENNAGNDVRRVGEEGLYELLAEGNIKTLNGASFSRIVTTDPHSFNTIRNEYPDFGGSYGIEHYTTFMGHLIEEGRLRFARKLNYRVTLHDPCHLGRYNKVFDAPRKILEALGCELAEMPRHGDNSFCCGAGGGRIWIPDPVGTEKPSQNRMREAAAIGGLEVFVVCCPKDLTMFEDALKTTGNEGKFVVKELIELIEEALSSPAPTDVYVPLPATMLPAPGPTV